MQPPPSEKTPLLIAFQLQQHVRKRKILDLIFRIMGYTSIYGIQITIVSVNKLSEKEGC